MHKVQSWSVRRVEIVNGWRARETPPAGERRSLTVPEIPAVVPGCIHTDLLRAGAIPDPFARMNERAVAWVDETDWLYETKFHIDEPVSPCAYLRFNGLDTIAEITLNGKPLGKTDIMFIEHEFPVGDIAVEGENTLRVQFRSALREGRERRKAWNEGGNDTLNDHPFCWGPRSFVRKAQYMYGWDWGPELVSCGIWKPVEFVNVPVARIVDWHHTVTLKPGAPARVHVEVTIERNPKALNEALSLYAELQEREFVEDPDAFGPDEIPDPATALVTVPKGKAIATVSLDLDVKDPELWWPVGSEPEQEEPFLYCLDLNLEGMDLTDHTDGLIGLRTIELVREPDADGKGEGFMFRVNGRDTFIRGANWIPADSFPSRLEHDEGRDKLIGRLEQAAAAGVNMLRVWGGGLYESDDFYDICDELGIMVWQDFPYACAYYPDTGEYEEASRIEATAAVRRLRNHPSLAMWCGNNECHQVHTGKWTGESVPPRYLGERLYHEVLPEVVRKHDPGRPYWPSSPFGGDDPNDPNTGDRHNWDVWHGRGDWVHYTEDRPRFVSEFGFASSCALEAWKPAMEPQDMYAHSPVARWHDKTGKGYETYIGFTTAHFPEPVTLEDLVYYTQLNQAEALKCGVDHYRRLKGRCWGTMFWQLNDCWPVQSWSVIDYAGDPKAAYHAMQRFYNPILMSMVREDDVLHAYVVNDTAKDIRGTVTLRIENFEGASLDKEKAVVFVKANGVSRVASLHLHEAEGHEDQVFLYGRLRLDETNEEYEDFQFLVEPKDLKLADPGLKAEVTLEQGWASIRLTTRWFAPYVWARLEGVPGVMMTNYMHIRPGKERIYHINRGRLPEGWTADDIRGRLRLRTL